MKSILVSGGIRYFLNNQEWDFLEKNEFPITRKSLNENEMVIVSNLCKRGILKAFRKDEQLFYKKNINKV